MSAFNYPKTPQSILQLLSNSFNLYTQSISKVLIWQVLFGIAITLAPRIWLTGPQISPWIKITVGLISLIVAQFVVLLVMRIMHNLATENNMPLANSFKIALKRLTPAVIGLLLILIGFIIFGFTVGALLGLLTGFFIHNSQVLLAVGAVPISFVFIYFSTRFMLYNPIILLDGKGILASIKSSFQLVKGYWWHAFGIFITISILNVIFPQMFGLLLSSGNKTSEAFIFWLVSSITTPFWSSSLLVLLNDLKLRHSLEIR